MSKKSITIADIVRILGEWELQDERVIWMPAGRGFEQDLIIGESTQEKLLSIIRVKYPKAYCKKGYFKEWDIMIPENGNTIEVKQDKMSNHTGNLVIEIEMPPGTPSALSTTTATYWVFDDGKEYIWCTPKGLKELVKSYKSVTFTGKGDTTPKVANQIKKKFVKEVAIKVTQCQTDHSKQNTYYSKTPS